MKHSPGTRRSATAFLLVFAIFFISVVGPSATGQQRGPALHRRATATQERPRLVLLIVVDQFRYDYLMRFGDLFGSNGLRRLMRDGASWVDANFDHMPTYTAPGHATLMTGAYPAETGIIANDWPDRETGTSVSSVSDESVKLLPDVPNERGSSPRRLIASTLGDELRLATNDRAKVIGVSVKDRAAFCHPAITPMPHTGSAPSQATWSLRHTISKHCRAGLPSSIRRGRLINISVRNGIGCCRKRSI